MSGKRDAMQAQPGMNVYDADAEPVGVVKESRPAGLLVGRSKHTDVFVPKGAIAEVSESDRRVDLSVPAAELQSPATA